jgi:hypothetical protein
VATSARANEEGEFSGDECVVLPANYLESPVAVSEIYADELASVATNLEIDHWTSKGFFRGTTLAALLWALPSIWTVCS